jgi:hypothetical protein
MDHAIVPRHIVLWCNAQLTLADALLRIGPADPGKGAVTRNRRRYRRRSSGAHDASTHLLAADPSRLSSAEGRPHGAVFRVSLPLAKT